MAIVPFHTYGGQKFFIIESLRPPLNRDLPLATLHMSLALYLLEVNISCKIHACV